MLKSIIVKNNKKKNCTNIFNFQEYKKTKQQKNSNLIKIYILIYNNM